MSGEPKDLLGNDRCDSTSRSSLAGINHDEKLHKSIIDVSRCSAL